MRNFQIVYLLLFIAFYLFLSFSAYKGIKLISESHKYGKPVRIFFIISGISIISAFFILYVWPYNVRSVNSFKLHLILNAILSIDIVAKLPFLITSFLGLFLKKNALKISHLMSFILSVALSLSMIQGTLFIRNQIKVNNITIQVNGLPVSFQNYKIVHISDLHLGSFFQPREVLEEISKRICNLENDIIVFTGDLVNNFSYETNGLDSVFQKMTNNRNCYSILGNHDYGNYSEWVDDKSKSQNFEKVVEAHRKFGFQILNNQNTVIRKSKDSIFIAGVENWGHPPFPQYAVLDKAQSGIPLGAFTILLSHDPSHWDEVIKKRDDIRLTLSGHTHGMQWGISRAGYKFSLAYLVRRQWSGLYQYGNNFLYVNTGLGMVAMPWRINMPPEITVITLKRSEVD